MRWAAPNFFPALLVCKLSRHSWDLGKKKKKSVFHVICRASHAFSDTARGLGFFFFSNRDKPWLFVCFTLYMSSGGWNRSGSRANTKPDAWAYLLFHSVYSQASADRMYTNTSPDTTTSGCADWYKKKTKNKNSIYSYIATPKSPKRLPFRQPTFAIKHKDWRVGTLYSHRISQTSPC